MRQCHELSEKKEHLLAKQCIERAINKLYKLEKNDQN
jgi:hypothetical protein